jgi:nitroreductase
MDAIEAILTRRSIRQYDGRPVPEDVINTLLRAGMYAPSAMDTQPWEFIVIRDAGIKKAASVIGPFWQALKDAPLGIMVLADMNACDSGRKYVQGCSAATENILLAAHALGLGGVWLGLYPDEDRIKGVSYLFRLPDYVIPVTMISIGYPAEEQPPHTGFQTKKVHYDKY